MNRNELQELAELRERVAKLEEKEGNLYLQLATVLEAAHLSGMTYSRVELVNIARHAGAIRDALQPFDDGVRAPLPVPPTLDAAQVAKAYGLTAPHGGIYSGPNFRDVWGKGVPYHWRNRGEPHWRQGNVEPTFHAAKEYRFAGSTPANLPPTAGES